jgi:hypothetical protein
MRVPLFSPEPNARLARLTAGSFVIILAAGAILPEAAVAESSRERDTPPPADAPAPAAAGRFAFTHHFIDRDLPHDAYRLTALVDLDFVTGGRGPDRAVYWFEHHTAGRWTRHVLGTRHPSDVGATALDVDGDGDLDLMRSNLWFENADGRGGKWIEHPIPFGRATRQRQRRPQSRGFPGEPLEFAAGSQRSSDS